MASRLLVVDIQSIVDLITHYSEGQAMPLGAEAKHFAVSDKLPRWISLIVESDEWKDDPLKAGSGYGGQAPIHFRYEGSRTMKILTEGGTAEWSPEGYAEAPKQN